MNLIAHLMAMRLGARVRAPGGIFYADTGKSVDPDSRGTIKAVTHAGALVAVLWDGDAEAVKENVTILGYELVSAKQRLREATQRIEDHDARRVTMEER